MTSLRVVQAQTKEVRSSPIHRPSFGSAILFSILKNCTYFGHGLRPIPLPAVLRSIVVPHMSKINSGNVAALTSESGRRLLTARFVHSYDMTLSPV